MPDARARERGFALLLTIWVLAILGALAAAFAASTRSETRLARNFLDAARARALAEAGVSLAETGLIELDPSARWHADGVARQLDLDEGSVAVSVQDEGGKIDLNAAPTELIVGLCNELAIADAARASLIEAINARRGVRLGGNAPPITFSAPLAFAPGVPRVTGPTAFNTLEELRQLPGMDRASFERLRPFLTVYSQTAQINPQTAPREVLLAIPGIDPRDVDRYLAVRNDPAATASGQPPPTLSTTAPFLAAGELHAVTIRAEATAPSGASFTRRVVASLTGIPLRPVQIMEWQQDIGDDDAPSPDPASR